MPDDEVKQHLVGTNPYIVSCIMEIINSHKPEDWKELGLYVYADTESKDIYLDDFLLSEKDETEERHCSVIYPCHFVKDNEYAAENMLVYFYTCITALENKLKYEVMRREEEDAKKARRDNNNKMGGTRRGRSKNPDDAERSLSDSQPST